MSRSIHTFLSLSTVVLLALAACGDDDNTSTSASSSSGSGAASSSSSSGGMGGMGAEGGMGGAGGLGGAGGMGGMTNSARNFYFWGDFATNDLYEIALYDGTMQSATTLAPDNLDGTDINAAALSPDGTQLAIAGHEVGDNSDFLYLYNTGDLATATTLVNTNSVSHTVDIVQVVFSPDGARIAYLSDFDNNGEDAVYVVPADGSAPPELISPIPPTNGDAKTLRWVDNTTLAYLGDITIDGIDNAWTVNVTSNQPPAVLVPPGMLTSAQELVEGYIGVDSMSRVYFKSDHQVDGLFQLFRVNTNGANLEQVPGTAIMSAGAEASIAGWSLSPNGDMLAFGTLPNPGDIGQVYVLDLSMPTATAVTSFTGNPMAGVEWHINDASINWSSDQAMIGFAGDWPLVMDDVDNSNGAFIASVSGTSAIRLMRPTVQLAQDYSAFGVHFSSDGTSAIVHGRLVNAGEADLFVTSDLTTPDQSPINTQLTASPNGGNVLGILPTP